MEGMNKAKAVRLPLNQELMEMYVRASNSINESVLVVTSASIWHRSSHKVTLFCIDGLENIRKRIMANSHKEGQIVNMVCRGEWSVQRDSKIDYDGLYCWMCEREFEEIFSADKMHFPYNDFLHFS